MRQIGVGRTADIYQYGADRALKLFRPEISERAVEEELRRAEIVFASGVPSPRPFGTVDVDGRIGIVYERANGPTLLARMIAEPGRLQEYARRLADIHADIHARSVDGIANPMKGALKRGIGAGIGLDGTECAAVLAMLERLPDGRALCHGDFHPDNVVLDEERIWILDWMTCASGDPAADAARTIVLLRFGSVPVGASAADANRLDGARATLVEQYMAHYAALTGTDAERIRAWLAPVAAARLSEGVPDDERRRLIEFVRSRLAPETAEGESI